MSGIRIQLAFKNSALIIAPPNKGFTINFITVAVLGAS
jgi:hypothetical protein